MNKEDKIVTIFRKNHRKLEEMPSPQSWEKLRRRLEDRKRQRHIASIYRPLAMIAALVGLVVLITSLPHLPSLSPKDMASQTQKLPSYPLEVLHKVMEAQQYRTQYQTKLQQHIEEGNPTNLLVYKQAKRPILLPKKKEIF